MLQRPSHCILFLLLFFLGLFRCAGQPLTSSEADGSDPATESEEGDAAEAVINGVTFLSLSRPDVDFSDSETPGCRSIIEEYTQTVTHNYCFTSDNDAQHSLTIWDPSGEMLLRVVAGIPCRGITLSPGYYEMEICHDGDGDAADLIFMAAQDISTSSNAVAWDPGDADYESEYDYETDASGQVSYVRYLNSNQLITFLTTETCTRCDLTNANLAGLDLTSANLTGSDLTGADLTGAILSAATLTKARFDDATLTGATLIGTSATSTSFKRADMRGTNLTNANFTHAILDNVDFSLNGTYSSNLTTVNLTRARLNNANISYSTLTNANLTRALMESANFDYTVLTGANFSYAKAGSGSFVSANLTNTILTRAYFNEATMTSAIFSGATMAYTRFNSANLTSANLTGATRTNPVFLLSTLTSATWTDGSACRNPSVGCCYDPESDACR